MQFKIPFIHLFGFIKQTNTVCYYNIQDLRKISSAYNSKNNRKDKVRLKIQFWFLQNSENCNEVSTLSCLLEKIYFE